MTRRAGRWAALAMLALMLGGALLIDGGQGGAPDLPLDLSALPAGGHARQDLFLMR